MPSPSHSLEAQPTTPLPYPLAPQTQPDHQGKHPRRHPSLYPEHPLRSHRSRPPDLKKADDEAARGAREIDPRRHLAARLGIGIEIIRVERDRDDHGAEHVQSPAQGDEHVVVGVLHGEADEHEPGQHEGRGDVAGQEAGFRVEPAVVPTHVERERVV